MSRKYEHIYISDDGETTLSETDYTSESNKSKFAKHALHPVKVGTKKIGFVPVRCVYTLKDVAKWAADENSTFDESLLVECLTYGVAVNLQRVAREEASGEKFTNTAFMRVADQLSAEELQKFAGDMAGLQHHCKKIWEDSIVNTDVDEDTIHTYNR